MLSVVGQVHAGIPSCVCVPTPAAAGFNHAATASKANAPTASSDRRTREAFESRAADAARAIGEIDSDCMRGKIVTARGSLNPSSNPT